MGVLLDVVFHVIWFVAQIVLEGAQDVLVDVEKFVLEPAHLIAERIAKMIA